MRFPWVSCALQENSGVTINAVRRTTLTAATCAVLALTGIAACGTVESLSAAQKIRHAAEKLGEQRSLKVELGIDADPGVIEKTFATGEDAMPVRSARQVAHLRASVSMEASKPLAEAGEKDLKAMALTLGLGKGENLAEIRLVDETVYLKADVDAIGKLFDTPMPMADDLPASMGAFKDLMEGRWVKTDADSTEGEGEGGGKGKGGGLDSKTQRRLQADLKEIFARRVTFSDRGEKDGVDHILAKGSAHDIAGDVIGALKDVTDRLPVKMREQLPTVEKDLKGLPDHKVGVDFALKDDALSRVTFDITQLGDPGDFEKGDKFDVFLGYAVPGKIRVPAGARELPKTTGGSVFGLDPESLSGAQSGSGASDAPEGSTEGLDEGDLKSDPEYRKAFEKSLRAEMKKEFGEDYAKGEYGDEIEKQIQKALKEEFGDAAV